MHLKTMTLFKVEIKEIIILSGEHAFDKVAIVASEQNVLHQRLTLLLVQP